MKPLKTALFLTIILLMTSCFKPDHSIRIKSDYRDTLINVTVGPASFGQVDPNATTGYIHIPEGTNNLSGVDKTSRFTTLSGTSYVTGKGKHRWTLTINSDGTLAFAEDK
jgi:hypothetical protein